MKKLTDQIVERLLELPQVEFTTVDMYRMFHPPHTKSNIRTALRNLSLVKGRLTRKPAGISGFTYSLGVGERHQMELRRQGSATVLRLLKANPSVLFTLSDVNRDTGMSLWDCRLAIRSLFREQTIICAAVAHKHVGYERAYAYVPGLKFETVS